MNQPASENDGTSRRIPPKYWLWGAGIVFVSYMTIYPTVQSMLATPEESKTGINKVEDITVDELVMLRSTEAFLTVWFFAFGATVGSYLNVVVYRSPRGESLLKKGSSCPTCNAKIESKDNIPILGWIWLEGKCRTCRMPISSRYPIVEAVTGCLFSLFFFVELLSGGINLPERIPNAHSGFVWVILYPKWDLIGLYVYHCLMLVSLLTWALIRYDREQVKLRSYATTFGMAILPVLIWPRLILISHQAVPPASYKPGVTEALLTGAIGAIVGLVIGLLISFILKKRDPENQQPLERELAAGLALVGFMMGWQAAVSTACLALAIRLMLLVISKPLRLPLDRWPLSGALMIAVTLQLAFWRILAESVSDWWPVVGFSITPLAICGGAMVTLIVLSYVWLNVIKKPAAKLESA